MNTVTLRLPPLAGEPWPAYWDRANCALRDCGYARSSRRVYRRVVRGLVAWLTGNARTPGADCTAARGLTGPAAVTAGDLREYLWSLAHRHCSWSWIGMSISVLRTLFDQYGGATLTGGLVTPRRPYHLPHTLSPDECGRLIRAGATLQERLALSLLYGCGLKPGEACMLRWEDVDTDLRALRVHRPASRLRPRSSCATTAAVRCVPMPADWAKWLCETATLSSPGAPMLSDGGGRGRSVRWMELVVGRAAARADLVGGVSAMTLRHSYAVHALEAGANLRAVQVALGHVRIETTLVYARLLSSKTTSPLDRLAPTPGCPVEPGASTNGTLPTAISKPLVPDDVKQETGPDCAGPGKAAMTTLFAVFLRLWRATCRAPP